MEVFTQVFKAIAWGACVLVCLFILLGSCLFGFAHWANIRDVEQTVSAATSIKGEVDSLSEELRRLAVRFSVVSSALNDEDAPLDLIEEQSRLAAQIQRNEDLLSDQMARFCDVGFGCSFYWTDDRYERLKDIDTSESDFRLGMFSAMSYWSADFKRFIDRQASPETIRDENLERYKGLLGASFLGVLSVYLLVALALYKRFTAGRYVILLVVAALPMLWAMYLTANFIDPAAGYVSNDYSDTLGGAALMTSFLYPFLVLPALHVVLKRAGISVWKILSLSKM